MGIHFDLQWIAVPCGAITSRHWIPFGSDRVQRQCDRDGRPRCLDR